MLKGVPFLGRNSYGRNADSPAASPLEIDGFHNGIFDEKNSIEAGNKK